MIPRSYALFGVSLLGALVACCGTTTSATGTGGGTTHTTSTSASGGGGTTSATGMGGGTTHTTSTSAGSGGAAGGPASSPCHSYFDCPSSVTDRFDCETSDPCVGDMAQCGPNTPRACSADADCSTGELCDVCDQNESVCRAKCASDAECDPGATCDATGRCVRRPCTAITDCPDNFTCSPVNGDCIRKFCTQDADCKGACVYNRCVEAVGYCVDCGP